ncbi:hypothetical protein BV898_00947 [Hypsibius exemplaris]|uniref:Gustatory receptor n=1 Tax=Hypsibius exemplaris TaxID=2072580 RepID=A0A1W0XCP2_HYPEX|nr:hypothetical protein BV898_00947 [Hypsibius exemplaris]
MTAVYKTTADYGLSWKILCALTFLKSCEQDVDKPPGKRFCSKTFRPHQLCTQLWHGVKILWYGLYLPVTILRQLSQIIYLLTGPELTFMKVLDLLRWRTKHIAYSIIVYALQFRQSQLHKVVRNRQLLLATAFQNCSKTVVVTTLKQVERFEVIITVVSAVSLVLAYQQTEVEFWVFEIRNTTATKTIWPIASTIQFPAQVYAGIRFVRVLREAVAPSGRVDRVPSERVDGVPSGRVDGVPPGRMDGVLSGRVDGVPSERVDGVPSGRVDGVPSGRVDGVPSGRVDGVLSERVDGVPSERVDGVLSGRVDGVPSGRLDGVLFGRLNGKNNREDREIIAFQQQLDVVESYHDALEETFRLMFLLHSGASVLLAAGLIGEMTSGVALKWTALFVAAFQTSWNVLFLIGIPAILCNNFKEEGEKLLQTIMQRMKTSKHVSHETQRCSARRVEFKIDLLTLRRENTFGFTAAGFFALDRTFVATLLGVLLTYALLIQQFLSEPRK